jgi:hypothetical protein
MTPHESILLECVVPSFWKMKPEQWICSSNMLKIRILVAIKYSMYTLMKGQHMWIMSFLEIKERLWAPIKHSNLFGHEDQLSCEFNMTIKMASTVFKMCINIDRNYTAMHTHVRWSVHLSALLITWFTWGDGLQRRYASDVAFCIVCFPLTVDNSDMN